MLSQPTACQEGNNTVISLRNSTQFRAWLLKPSGKGVHQKHKKGWFPDYKTQELQLCSLRSKRFRIKQRSVFCPREKWDENQKNEGVGRGRALCPFLVQPHFSRGKNIENPFLGLPRLPNPTETLATQVTVMRLIRTLKKLLTLAVTPAS